jgi:hypothetical protein
MNLKTQTIAFASIPKLEWIEILPFLIDTKKVLFDS